MRGVGVLVMEGLGVFVQEGGVFWLACAGLAPRAPLLLVGRRRRARGWVRFVMGMPVCVWWRHGGCRPTPQL